MEKSLLPISVLFGSVLAVAPIIASAAVITPSTVLSNTQSYDGQPVSVSGTVKGFSTRRTPRGTISMYQLCDRQCVNAVDRAGGAQTNGSTATVNGTFHASLQTRRQTLTNVIVVG